MLKRIGSVTLALVFLAGLGGVIYHQINAAQVKKARAAKKSRRIPPAVLVEVETVKSGPIQVVLRLNGTMEARTQATVFSMVPGVVKKLKVSEGDIVKKGQLLARLDAYKMVLAVQQARAGRAMARVNQAQMKLTYRRMKALYKQGALPKAQFDKVEAGYKAAGLQVSQANAGVGLAGSQLADAYIRAPIAGTVLKKFMSLGDLSSAAGMMKTSPLLIIADVSRLKVRVHVVEKDLGRVHVGQPASLTVDTYPGRTFRGRVTEIGTMVDPMTRTAEVTVEIPNPFRENKTIGKKANQEGGDRLLKVGMFARVAVRVGERKSVLVVPRDVVLGAAGSEHVFVVQGGKARRRKVVLGLNDGKRVEIMRGLRAGDRLVVLGQRLLRADEPVRVAAASPLKAWGKQAGESSSRGQTVQTASEPGRGAVP